MLDNKEIATGFLRVYKQYICTLISSNWQVIKLLFPRCQDERVTLKLISVIAYCTPITVRVVKYLGKHLFLNNLVQFAKMTVCAKKTVKFGKLTKFVEMMIISLKDRLEMV